MRNVDYSRSTCVFPPVTCTSFCNRLPSAYTVAVASADGPDAPARRAKAWALVCQVVIAANEFVYVN